MKVAIDDVDATLKYGINKLDYKVDLASFISIDFNRAGPLVFIKQIHDELERRSAKNGIATVAFVNSQSMHTLHAWVQGLAKRGLLTIAVCNGGPPAVAPFNGTKGLLGTNPLAYGIPGKNKEIFCIDMATLEIPYFEILDANKSKTPLRERSAVDSSGEFTTDASKALDFSKSKSDPVSNIVPMGGGYKGYYINYLAETLTSALIGMPSSPEMNNNFVPEEHGAILLAFNPKVMGTEANFKTTVGSLHAAIKSQAAKKGRSVRTPGEENNKRYALSQNKDITVDDDLIKRLRALAR